MSTCSVENQDLQTYLDSFNKEIEEGNGSLEALDSDAVDKMALRILHEDDEEDDEEQAETVENNEDNMYFVDEEGNYYLRSSKNNNSQECEPCVSAKRKRTSSTLQTRTKKPAKSKSKEDADDDDVGYVLIVDPSNNQETTDVEEPEDQIFEFDENEEVLDEYKSPVIPTKTVFLKSNSDRAKEQRCTHCDYTTDKRYLLSRHLRAHSDERPYKCSVCERGFKTNSALVNHMNTHMGNKPHACKTCDMRFTTSGELVRHNRYRHTNEKPHKCTECDYASVELSKLRRHIRCHTGERPYQCPHCTYASPDTFKLKRHLRTHTGEKPYQCDICQARFTQSNSLKAHRLIHSVNDKPVFQCTLCPTTCGRKTDLRLHMQKLHHSDEPIPCKRCGKKLPDRYSYKMHVKTHDGEKCYRCETCSYASISLRHLEAHMFIHTNEKPFKCEECSMAFRQRQLLQRHINLHHKIDYKPPKPRARKHTCPTCDRAYANKGNLMRHMEYHDKNSNAPHGGSQLKIAQIQSLHDSTIGSSEKFNYDDYENDDDIEDEYDEYEMYEQDEMKANASTMIEYEEPMFDTAEIANDLRSAAFDNVNIKKEKNTSTTEVKTISIKKEPNGKEYVSVEVNDGQQFMVVEVMQCEDDDDDEHFLTVEGADNSVIQVPVDNSVKNGVNNCFGFNEVPEEIIDETDNKGTIQLLDIIEED